MQPRAFTGQQVQQRQGQGLNSRRSQQLVVYAIKDGASLEGRKLRVAVVGGGPGGACTADTLARGGIETYLIERKLDNCKVSILARPVVHFQPYAGAVDSSPVQDPHAGSHTCWTG